MLKAVIARLLGLITKRSDKSAQQTQPVGLANQEPTTPRGNKRSVRSTKPQSAQQKPKRKSSPAKQVTQGKLRKTAPKPAQQAVKASGRIGSQQVTPALLSVKPKRKAEPKAVQQDMKAQSPKSGKKSAPKTRGHHGQSRKTLA